MIRSIGTFVKRVFFLSNSLNQKENAEPLTSRGFNIIFLASLHPLQVFDFMNPLATALLSVSKLNLECFFDIIFQLQTKEYIFHTIDVAVRSAFPGLLRELLAKYNDWRHPQQLKLSCQVKNEIIEMYKKEDLLPLDEVTIRNQIGRQIELLRCQLQTLAGVDAVKEFDRQYQEGVREFKHTPDTEDDNEETTNEKITHALLIDQTFQIADEEEINPWGMRSKSRKQQSLKLYWFSMLDGLRLVRPCYARVIHILKTIKSTLIEAGGNKRQVNAAIDIEFIQVMIHAGVFQKEDVINLITGAVSITEALLKPNRIKNFTTKWNTQRDMLFSSMDIHAAFCKSLVFVYNQTNVLRIDTINDRCRKMIRTLKNWGIDHEKENFKCKMDSGKISLDRTKEWILNSIKRSIAANYVDIDLLRAGNSTEFEKVLATGFCHLLLNSPNPATTKPETFRFDHKQLLSIAGEIECMIDTTVLMAGTAHIIGKHHLKRETQKEILDNIGKAIKDCTSCDILNERFGQSLDIELSKTSLDEAKQTKIKKTVPTFCSDENTVFNLFYIRVLEIWMKRFSKSPITEKDILGLGYGQIIIQQIIHTTDVARRIYDISVQVHGERYNRLILETCTQL